MPKLTLAIYLITPRYKSLCNRGYTFVCSHATISVSSYCLIATVLYFLVPHPLHPAQTRFTRIRYSFLFLLSNSPNLLQLPKIFFSASLVHFRYTWSILSPFRLPKPGGFVCNGFRDVKSLGAIDSFFQRSS